VDDDKILRQLGLDWFDLDAGFTWDSPDLDESKGIAVDAWRRPKALIQAGEHRLVVLDEITYPMSWIWISTEDVVSTIAGRPEDVNIICTGRDAPDALIEIAHTVTEMRKVKHAYDQGIMARRGIDY